MLLCFYHNLLRLAYIVAFCVFGDLLYYINFHTIFYTTVGNLCFYCFVFRVLSIIFGHSTLATIYRHITHLLGASCLISTNCLHHIGYESFVFCHLPRFVPDTNKNRIQMHLCLVLLTTQPMTTLSPVCLWSQHHCTTDVDH